MLLVEGPIVLYHGSTIGNLRTITPHISTHNQAYVYATPYIGIAVAYLARFDDFDISTGTYNGKPYIVERYKNALKTIYKKPGYIYTVEGTNFVSNIGYNKANSKIDLRGFEVVSDKPVKVISMEKITNPYEYIRSLNKSELDLYMYPNRPSFIPKDDNDLIAKAKLLYSQFQDDSIYEELYKKHPNLLKR